MDYSNHESKCRLCFKLFGFDKDRMQITTVVEQRYLELTNSHLKVLDGLSTGICTLCDSQLKEFCKFKHNVVDLQNGLLKFVAQNNSIGLDFGEIWIKAEKLDGTICKIEQEIFDEPQSELGDFSSGFDFQDGKEDDQVKSEDDTKINLESLNSGSRPLRARRTIASIEPGPKTKKQKREPVLNLKSTCPEEGCNKHFKSVENLRMHFWNVHDESKKVTCALCGLVVKEKRTLQRHIDRIHVRVKNFFCDICGYGGCFKSDISEHMARHANQEDRKTFRCDQCLFKTAHKQSLQTHKKYLHPDSNSTHVSQVFTCHCGKQFKYKTGLSTHMKKVHEKIKKKGPVPHLKRICPFKGCNKKFVAANRLRLHFSNVHDESTRVMCTQCGLVVKGTRTLEKHIDRVHLKLKNFFCDICGYSGTFKSDISEHMVRHTSQDNRKTYKCDQCSFKSAHKQSIRTHKLHLHPDTHSTLAFSCHCGKQFKSKMNLTSHIRRTHEKVKNFKCTLCEKAFEIRRKLRDHVKMQHQKIRDMPCDTCGKLFGTMKTLKHHQKHHEAPKFKCEFEGCQKAYVTNPQLMEHMKVHEGSRDINCHLCDKTYLYQKHLTLHLNVAHNATTFHCEICPFTNGRKDYLRNHLNNKHKHLTDEEKQAMLARVKVTRKAV